MSRATDNAVYNSRIAGMLTPSCFRRVRFAFILPILLLAATVWGQNWAGAEEQLARKIVVVTGARTMTVEVSNRSSLGKPGLGSTTVDDIRRGLLTQLAVLGARFVNSEQAAATVQVFLSEDLQNYVWIAQIHQGANESSVVMVSLPRPETQPVVHEAAALAIHKTLLWSQGDRILDVAVVDGNPT